MEQLRKYLEKRGLSQAEFGRRFGVSQPTVSDWLSGAIVPSPDNLVAISEETGISIDELLKGRKKH